MSRLFQRTAGLLLALALPLTAGESLVGPLRDGVVHHETSAQANSHLLFGGSGHGHEDSSPSHQHGKAADHCTHQHSVPLALTRVQVAPLSSAMQLHPGEMLQPFDQTPSDVFHPPRLA